MEELLAFQFKEIAWKNVFNGVGHSAKLIFIANKFLRIAINAER